MSLSAQRQALCPLARIGARCFSSGAAQAGASVSSSPAAAAQQVSKWCMALVSSHAAHAPSVLLRRANWLPSSPEGLLWRAHT
eukprot:scaffold51129_cov19-Tisochrysis_lutea.AAC.2